MEQLRDVIIGLRTTVTISLAALGQVPLHGGTLWPRLLKVLKPVLDHYELGSGKCARHLDFTPLYCPITMSSAYSD